MTEGNGGTELAVIPERITERQVTLFGTDDPVKVVELASRISTTLASVIEKQHLYSDIKGKKHVRVEGWTLCGSMLGVFPICAWTRPIEGGFEARVEARLRDGSIVGAAEAQCTRSESTWNTRDDYALKSMAQTRATSKALRLPLGFIVAMGGYDATPAEEMGAEAAEAFAAKAPATVPAPQRKAPPAPANAPPRPSMIDRGPVITEPQSKRFYAIWKGAGKEQGRVTDYLVKKFGIADSRQMPKSGYDEACRWAADGATNVEPPPEPGSDMNEAVNEAAGAQ